MNCEFCPDQKLINDNLGSNFCQKCKSIFSASFENKFFGINIIDDSGSNYIAFSLVNMHCFCIVIFNKPTQQIKHDLSTMTNLEIRNYFNKIKDNLEFI